ncbi:MAG: hypothetical protein RBS37_08640 [Bacteroidales bacterium]|jgi:hypothetical protein|nr:hypothetical protein [Bacteroidales bacterium]
MNKTTPIKSDIFKEIEELYFSNKFKDVIAVWENNMTYYQIDKKSQTDNNILEAIATSYYETGMYERSLFYLDAQIEQLKNLELPSHEKQKKYRYYYLNKVNVYTKQNRRILEYRTLWEYLKHFGKDDTFLELSNFLEEYFYRKYLLFNKYFGYAILMLIAIAILIPLFNLSIPRNIYRPYNIASIICVMWVVLNLLFPKIFKGYLLNSVKYLLRPR